MGGGKKADVLALGRGDEHLRMKTKVKVICVFCISLFQLKQVQKTWLCGTIP